MSDWLLDRLKDYLPFCQNLRYCVSMVRMEFEPDALQTRLNRICNPTTTRRLPFDGCWGSV